MHCKRLSIVVGAILLASTLTGCAEFYGWRSDSQTTREPRPERAKTETERAAKPLQLSGAVASDRIVVTVKAEDLCRINTITPIADVTRTKREPTTSGNAAGATLVVAALWFFTPTILASQCASGNDCGLDGSILDRWQKIGFSTLGIGLGSIAVAHGLWALAANRDSEEIKVVDKLVAAGQWKTCPGKIPAGGAAAVAITHPNGNKTQVGTALFDAQGNASVAIGKAGEGFGVNGDGDVVASYEQLTAHVACGSWTACNQAHRCAMLRAHTPRHIEQLAVRFGQWRASGSQRAQNSAADFGALLDRIDQISTVLAGGVADCPQSERKYLDDLWRIAFSDMRVDALAGLRIPALEQLDRDARTEVRWAGVGDPYHQVAAQWLARLPADLAGYKANVDQQCSKEASSLAALKKRGKWQDLLATVDVVYQKCEGSQAATSIAAVRTWTVESGCSAVKSVESCLEACRLGGQSSCRILASAEELVALHDECAASAGTTARRLENISREAETLGELPQATYNKPVKRRTMDELLDESLGFVAESIQKCQPACARRASGACELVSQMRTVHSDLVRAKRAEAHQFLQMLHGLNQIGERQNAQQRKGGPVVCVARCQVEADDCMSRSTNFRQCRSNHESCLSICR